LQFLQDEVDGYYEASIEDHQLFYNTADMQLIYSSASEGEGSVIGGVHLELLVDHHPPPDSANNSFWTVCETRKNDRLGINVISTAVTELSPSMRSSL
jgi:DnaJ family protein C protein 13